MGPACSGLQMISPLPSALQLTSFRSSPAPRHYPNTLEKAVAAKHGSATDRKMRHLTGMAFLAPSSSPTEMTG